MKLFSVVAVSLLGSQALAEETPFGVRLGDNISNYEVTPRYTEDGLTISTIVPDTITANGFVASFTDFQVVTTSNDDGEICVVVGYSQPMSRQVATAMINTPKNLLEIKFGPSEVRTGGLFEGLNYTWGLDTWEDGQRVDRYAEEDGQEKYGAVQIGITRALLPEASSAEIVQVAQAYSITTTLECQR